VHRLAPRFFGAAQLVLRKRPGMKLVVPALASRRPAIEDAARAAGLGGRLQIVDGQSHSVLAACDLALVASGTATLEAALFKRPMVIAYAVNWLSYRIMKPRQLQPWIGLPNILCGEFVVPELVQHDANPELLAAALLDWLEAPARMAAVQEKFTALHELLRRDTATLATDAIEKIIHS
jgi:lipid-A-disaccharide synthase